MNIEERIAELDEQFEDGLITQSEWALLFIIAQEDEETYPNVDEK
jgi:hypothetical protein